MSEPVAHDRDGTVARVRAVPYRMNDRARALIDGALDRVFDEPYDVPTAEDFERLMLEHHVGSGPGGLASTGAMVAFLRSATPIAERMFTVARVGTGAASKSPFLPAKVAKYALAAIPMTLSLTSSARRGVHELQVLASYLIDRLRQAGLEPERGFVRALTLSIALNPDRRPQLDAGAGRVTTSVAQQWIFRAIGKDSGEAVRRRTRAQLAAVERLDLHALAEQWAQRTA